MLIKLGYSFDALASILRYLAAHEFIALFVSWVFWICSMPVLVVASVVA